MKATIFFVLGFIISLPYTTQAQKLSADTGSKNVDVSFTELVDYFNQSNGFRKDTLKLPLLLVSEDYKVVLADSALHLTKHRRVLTNPFSADKYPLSYSVIYQNCLVSLLSPGYFACFNIDGWQRNLQMEKQLNKKRFNRYWLIDGHLIGLSNEHYWKFTQKGGWQIYSGTVPFKTQPKLFEDADFLVYNECNGEFGGRLFFFDKQTKKTYWTESTCAVWVRHTSGGYNVLSSLGHMMGSADEMLITNPRSLPELTGQPANNESRANDTSKPAVLFNLYEIQLFGGLKRGNQVLYLLHHGVTCLATFTDRTFTIVDPLFNDGLYTHQPVTTDYKGIYLINLDFYGIGGNREVACLVFKNYRVTLLDWHEMHSH